MSNQQTIGIIGAGNIGQAFARVAVRAGRHVVIANSRDPKSLAPTVERLGPGVSAATVAEAASAPIVVIAVPWANVADAVSGLAWNGQIVIDANNAASVSFADGVPSFTPAELHGQTSSEILASRVPGARVVKAANTLPAELLAADPRDHGGERVLFLSGDDEAAKADVAALLSAAGFFTIDLGGLAGGGRIQQFLTGPLAGLNLVKLP